MEEELKNLPGNEECPCGSGLKYFECCADRGGPKWRKDSEGKIIRQVKMGPEMVDIMKEHVEGLEKNYYKRPLQPEDKLFPNIDPKELTKNIVEALLDANIGPTIIWIFLKEELLLSQENAKQMSTSDRVDIINAVMEYVKKDKEEILKPYKDTLGEETYERTLELFQDMPGDEDLVKKYLDMLADDAVMQVYQNHFNKIGRNDPCPCGSGKKFKKCHGQ